MDGTSVEADLYIPATGVFPNNTFIPPELLSEDGWINTDQYLAVKGAANVYALGDIVEGQPKLASAIKSQISVVAHNLKVDITGSGVRHPLKPPALSGMAINIGSGGTGQIGQWVPWGWVISWLRGDYFLSKTDMFVSEN